MPDPNVLDRILVAEVIQRERAARDAHLWPEMAACWHPEATVDVSWFQGSGPDFIAATQKNATGKTLSFHAMSPSVVAVRGDRAIADTGCAVHGVRALEDCEVVVVSHTRLLCRALRVKDDWLLSGLRIVYICDLLLPRNPAQLPAIDPAALAPYRSSYRYLSYILAQSGHVPRTDLPGVDQPETVDKLRASEQRWLNGT